MDKHQDQINTVIEYIYIHLDSEIEGILSLDKLSVISKLSKYHFSRVFSAYTGLTVYRFTQRLKLKRASYKLAFHPDQKIIDIALEAGFESHEAFNRSFKKVFGQTPKTFRANPKWEDWHTRNQLNQGVSMQDIQVDIIQFSEQPVALLEHRGAPAKLNHSVAKFIEWRKSTDYSPITSSRTFGLAYHDPQTVAAEDFMFDICGSITQPIKDNPQGVYNSVIPAGRCAKITHRGSHDQMDKKIYFLYQDWLSTSGESLRDFPCFFEYKNFFPEVKESDLITEIYLPIE